MEKSLRTFVKKGLLLSLIIGLIVVLSGCGMNTTPIDSASTGIFDHYLVFPFSLLIKKIAALFGGYGIAIIMLTLAIRVALTPFMVKQTKSSHYSQTKMKAMKPEMDAIQKKYKGQKQLEDQKNMQAEMTALYQKHDYNPLSMVMGCLPMIIQIPFLIGFYYAIRRTPEIAAHSFLWFNLGQPDLLLAGIAVICYFLQSRVSLIGLPENQRKQMAMMGFISPVMIGIISINMAAALPLYWIVSSAYLVIQTFIIKKAILKADAPLKTNKKIQTE